MMSEYLSCIGSVKATGMHTKQLGLLPEKILQLMKQLVAGKHTQRI
jgi:hypothetical protein